MPLRIAPLCLLALAGCATVAPRVVEPSPAVARFRDRIVRQSEVDLRAAEELRKLEEQLWQLRTDTAERIALEALVAEAAKRDGTPEESWLDRQLSAPPIEVSEAQLQALYDKVKARVPAGMTYQDVKPQLAQAAERDEKARRARVVFAALKKDAGFELLLAAPVRPRKAVEASGPVRGPASAPVTIVEFADFECPFCGRAADTVTKVLAAYPTQVRLVFRNFPLSFHARAPKAAEAAACADEQGRFWELHDSLFETQALEVDDLKAQAARVGVDAARFDQCLDSGRMAARVKRDQGAGQQAGISGTPAFFINGIRLDGAQPEEAFARIIDQELAPAKAP
jgi:protein-disulfide isomerase